MILRGILVLLAVSFALTGFAQRKQKPVTFKKHYNEILPASPQYKLSGWHFAPGATYMFTPFISLNKSYSAGDSLTFESKVRATGKPGFYAEIGRYNMLPHGRLFKYLDYGVSYKGLRGKETSEGQLIRTSDEQPVGAATAGEGSFGYHYTEAFFNLNSTWRISKYNLVQQSIGINAGYAFLSNYSGTTVGTATPQNPGRFSTQLHYKLGFGIKMRGNWMVIPSLETPILNILPFEPPRSSLGFFASRYRPVILSVRILLMRPSNTMDCTPVRTREGVKMPTDMDKQKQMNQTR